MHARVRGGRVEGVRGRGQGPSAVRAAPGSARGPGERAKRDQCNRAARVSGSAPVPSMLRTRKGATHRPRRARGAWAAWAVRVREENRQRDAVTSRGVRLARERPARVQAVAWALCQSGLLTLSPRSADLARNELAYTATPREGPSAPFASRRGRGPSPHSRLLIARWSPRKIRLSCICTHCACGGTS